MVLIIDVVQKTQTSCERELRCLQSFDEMGLVTSEDNDAASKFQKKPNVCVWVVFCRHGQQMYVVASDA